MGLAPKVLQKTFGVLTVLCEGSSEVQQVFYYAKGSVEPCDPSDHLQESPSPPGPKSQKSLKKSPFGGSAKKVPENRGCGSPGPSFAGWLFFSRP